MNWMEGLDNKMCSGRVISANLCLKSTYGAGNLQPSGTMGPLNVCIYILCVYI